MDNLVGQSLGQYTIRRALGRGGMASVYLAYHPQMNREVAIKVLPREFVNDEKLRVRFEREAQTIAALEHPAIVPVYDFGEMDGQPYLVMRYMPGGSLADRIREGPVPLEKAVRIFERIAAALDAAHKRGIIHRDIKPANILFDAYDEAYLSDFGIAKLAETTMELTGTGIIGTPAYIAPEMASPGGVQPLIDIYALGVTLFQALTGSLPYNADTPMGLLMAHMSQPVPDITSLRPDLPRRIQHVIEQSLAKDPTARYQSALSMVADLSAATALIDQRPPGRQAGAEGAEATLLDHAPTFAEAAAQPAPAGTAQAVAGVEPRPPLAAPKKGRVPAGVWIAGGLVGVVLCVGLVAGGATLFASSLRTTPTPEIAEGATGGALAEVTGEPPGAATELPDDVPTSTPEFNEMGWRSTLPQVINQNPPVFTVDGTLFEALGCPDTGYTYRWCEEYSMPNMVFGCQAIQGPDPMLGGLDPYYPIVKCLIEDLRDGAVESSEYVYREGCMRAFFVRYVFADGNNYQMIQSEADLRAAFAPVESPDEALSYALAATGLSAQYGLEAPSGYRYFVDLIQDSHVIEDDSGYLVTLFDFYLCGCGPHPQREVVVHVAFDGTVEQVSDRTLFEDPQMDDLCVD